MLEALRSFEFDGADGWRRSLLDAVGVVTGVSGGSFTALAYGLYGHRLFEQYEPRFLERIAIIVVNSLSQPATGWDRLPTAPGVIEVLLQATGVPIDHYSYEAIDLLRPRRGCGGQGARGRGHGARRVGGVQAPAGRSRRPGARSGALMR